MPTVQIDYDATNSPVLNTFHQDNSFIRAIMGPVGSGKSVACSVEVLRRAMEQEPDQNNERKTRAVIVRNTYRELMDTTVATFFEWIPHDLGKWRVSDHTFHVNQKLPDGTTLKLEVLFRALDTPKDLRKLLSLEVTFCWFNEAREIPWSVIDLMQTRIGRYPSMRDGGATWDGIWLDTNPPDDDSKFYKIFEELRPEGYRLFRQPGGTSPEAENVQNLKKGYYDILARGKEKDWIKVYIDAEYGFVIDGKPIYPEYVDGTHYLGEEYTPATHIPVVIGIDFGLTPAACFMQQVASGQWIVFDELVTEDMGASRFGQELKFMIGKKYPHHQFEVYGDPAGEQRVQTDENTPFNVLRAQGIDAIPAPTNDFTLRRESVSQALSRLDMAGLPGLVFRPGTPMLRKAMAGGYAYKRLQVSGADRFHDKPDKNKYSHVAEALQYGLCGAGEGFKVIKSKAKSKPLDYSFYDTQVV